MELQIFIRGVDGGAGLREMAEEKFTTALTRFNSHVRRAIVRLEDETGPEKDSIDKVCAVELALRTGDIRIREVAESFSAAIELALDRARTALSRQVNKDKRGIGGG
jgi:ribosome-associated translation inhibitor RaiA